MVVNWVIRGKFLFVEGVDIKECQGMVLDWYIKSFQNLETCDFGKLHQRINKKSMIMVGRGQGLNKP